MRLIKKNIAIITSGRASESSTEKYTRTFLEFIQERKNFELNVDFINIKRYNIKNCQGCATCFFNGQCPLIDDMPLIKEILSNADAIVFATPVYLNHLPGDLKNLLDRLSSWTHLFYLIGKIGVILINSSNSGTKETADYLFNVLLYMGLITPIILTNKGNTLTPELIYHNALIFEDFLSKKRTLVVPDKMDYSYRQYKQIIIANQYPTFEYFYWKEKNLLNIHSLQTLIV